MELKLFFCDWRTGYGVESMLIAAQDRVQAMAIALDNGAWPDLEIQQINNPFDKPGVLAVNLNENTG